jgi:hypothetical protein
MFAFLLQLYLLLYLNGVDSDGEFILLSILSEQLSSLDVCPIIPILRYVLYDQIS